MNLRTIKNRLCCAIKTAENWLMPEWYQTEDNNIDPANQFENCVITEQLMEYEANLNATMKLLKDYCYFKSAREENLLLTEKDKTERAEQFYNNLLDCNLIRNGLLVQGVLEEICNVIER